MGIEVRTITDGEFEAWCAGVNTGFFSPVGAVNAETFRPDTCLDRTWAGFDGDIVVATLRSFRSQLTVPGGAALEASAVTSVTTTSTHRRRGLATRLITGDLAASAERGEQVSVLISAEWPIYGRFGYGASTERQSWTLDTSTAQLRHQPRGSVEYIDRDTARALAPEIHERHRRGRPGELARSEFFWDLEFGIVRPPSWSEPKPSFYVAARDPAGSAIGVAQYEYEGNWEHGRPKGEVTVELFVTSDPAAESLLWHHLISLDLTVSVDVRNRPVDDLLPLLLVNARHARARSLHDFLWVRPLDVAGMLAARSYLVSGQLVIEVVDAVGLAAGRFALDGGPEGASCARTAASADLTLDVAVLGSICLGGYGLRRLAAAGLVDEASPGAVTRADAMFRSPVAPWCSTCF
ncbi:MAG TPA: GNAT family N-acetyltransferase [Pseudonocardiaceae bacterium]|nr:GNAT family N-acetyltransferase [Pseudonocardiaceae bacterium]